MRKNFRVTAALLPAVLVLLGGCGILGIGEDSDRERLERSRRVWSEKASSNYHFVLERLCFCPLEVVSAVEIHVENDEVVSRRYVESGQPVTAQYVELFPSMEGVFDLVEDALDRRAGRLEVTYDSEFGFPVRASIDYIVNAVDDELAFNVRGFLPE